MKHRLLLIILGILSLVLSLGSFAFDDEVGEFAGSRSEEIRDTAEFISDWGDWPQLMAFGAVLVGLSFAFKSRSMRRAVLCMMLASTLAGILANMSRLTTGRTRPTAQHVDQGWYGPVYDGKLTIGKSKFNSFPSGHTATAVGFFGVLLFLRLPWSLLGLLLLPIIPAGRIFEEAHHISDVVVSTILALWVAWFCLWKIYPALERKFTKAAEPEPMLRV